MSPIIDAFTLATGRYPLLPIPPSVSSAQSAARSLPPVASAPRVTFWFFLSFLSCHSCLSWSPPIRAPAPDLLHRPPSFRNPHSTLRIFAQLTQPAEPIIFKIPRELAGIIARFSPRFSIST